MDDEQEDLNEVIREETNRGRRRIDPKARQERKQKLDSARKLLTIATEAEFLKAMRAVGLREGSAELSEALRIWRGYRS